MGVHTGKGGGPWVIEELPDEWPYGAAMLEDQGFGGCAEVKAFDDGT